MHKRCKELYNEAVDNLIDLFKVHGSQNFSKKVLDFLREFYNNGVMEPVNIYYTKNGKELCATCKKGNRDIKIYIGDEEISYVLNCVQLYENIVESGKIKHNITVVIQRLADWITKAETLDKFTDISEYNDIEIHKEGKT